MLITKEVEVKITKQNIKHYEKLGLFFNLRDVIFVKTENLPKNTHKRIDVECDVCGKTMNMTYQTYNVQLSCLNFITCKKCTIEKSKKLNIIKHGVDNFLLTSEFKEKSKQTKIDRYGDENYNNPEKNIKTCLEKYGVEHVLQNEEFRIKLNETCLKRYGNENYNNSKKSKETCLKRYGETIAMKNRDVVKKSLNVKMKKRIPRLSEFGVIKLNDDNKYVCKNGHTIEMNKGTFQSRLKYETILCPICNPLNSSNTSGYQNQLIDFIRDNYDGDIEINNRKIIKNELDIYLPELKLAIEFNGLFWHNEIGKPNNNYHKEKTEECEKIGIDLIHIYEDDWLMKKNMTKSKILKYLLKDKIIDNFKIMEVEDEKLIEKFLNDNYSDGYFNFDKNVGLFNECEELLCLMLMNKNRILTICEKLEGCYKNYYKHMLDFFIKKYNPKKLTYGVNRSWPIRKEFYDYGFKESKRTEPNVYYVKGHNRILKKEKGLFRIYDSGNLELIFKTKHILVNKI